jgi:hypothetical protein
MAQRYDGISMNGSINEAQVTLASAATMNIGAAAGNSILVTGTTNITAFDTIQAGTVRTLTFAGTLTLTYNGTSLILPTGASILTQSGDVAVFQSLGSGNWKCVNYQRADGSALVGAPSSLAATLLEGNTTSGTDIEVSNADKIVLKANTQPDVSIENNSGTLFVNGVLAASFSDAPGTGTFSTGERIDFSGSTPAGDQVFQVGINDGSAGIMIQTTDGVDSQDIILRPDGFSTLLNYQPGQTFTQPYEIVNKEYVDSRPIPGYFTVSNAGTDWSDLIAANGLIPGSWYRVTSAYTFDFYGLKDIVVVADSVNTIQTTGWVVFGDYFVPYTVDASFANTGFFSDCIQQMALGPDAVLGYLTGFNWRFNNGLPVFILDSLGLTYQAQIQGQDPSSFIFNNVKALDGGGPGIIGAFGTYVPETAPAAADDYFAPYPTLRTQRIALSAADIQAGAPIALSQFPAVAGSYWNATEVIVSLTAGGTPFTNTLFVQAAGAANDQWRFALTSAISVWERATDRRGNGDCFAKSAPLEIQFSGADAFGDGSAIIWVTSELLTT